MTLSCPEARAGEVAGPSALLSPRQLRPIRREPHFLLSPQAVFRSQHSHWPRAGTGDSAGRGRGSLLSCRCHRGHPTWGPTPRTNTGTAGRHGAGLTDPRIAGAPHPAGGRLVSTRLEGES